MMYFEVDRDNNIMNIGKLYCFVFGNFWYFELKLIIIVVELIVKQIGEDNEMLYNFVIFFF